MASGDADWRRSRAQSGGEASAKSPTRKYPLRKIVREYVTEEGLAREELECGHVMRPRSDLIGPTNAIRRRCRQCYLERQPKTAGARMEDAMADLQAARDGYNPNR